ncbi:hypothetical protein ANI02nite_27210 [Acetobacter nitrogenifigens DSM 23921 = NBRC 105050]|uniref:Uncharacterized protein n=1 Tax=Acetobacter nitrogenifigens DSM 23921 = NBRC 105050 TaxID=1120919 RepID=A0A511XD01_9PROT|nr:hypothetical protein ANI02nite_27210 [Acetobacter nitrogenifigens DSM 23921 = NBRC 105050]
MWRGPDAKRRGFMSEIACGFGALQKVLRGARLSTRDGMDWFPGMRALAPESFDVV